MKSWSLKAKKKFKRERFSLHSIFRVYKRPWTKVRDCIIKEKLRKGEISTRFDFSSLIVLRGWNEMLWGWVWWSFIKKGMSNKIGGNQRFHSELISSKTINCNNYVVFHSIVNILLNKQKHCIEIAKCYFTVLERSLCSNESFLFEFCSVKAQYAYKPYAYKKEFQ